MLSARNALREPYDVAPTIDEGISLVIGARLGSWFGRQIVRPHGRRESMGRSATKLTCAYALWPPLSDGPWGFLPTLECPDGGGDLGSPHQWMEDAARVSDFAVGASHAFIILWIFTPTVFWPMIRELWHWFREDRQKRG